MPRCSCCLSECVPYLNRLLELLQARKLRIEELIRLLEQMPDRRSIDLTQKVPHQSCRTSKFRD